MEFEILNEIERNSWIDFHKWAYEDDLKQAKETKSPRWKIIQGYYAMHDITKLILGKKFNIKVKHPEIHAKAIEALEANLKDSKKEKLIELLNKAQEKFKDIELKRLDNVIELLKQAKRQRGQSQYYTDRFSISIFEERLEKEAEEFMDNVVNPFIEIIKGFLDDRNNTGKQNSVEGNKAAK